MLRRCDGFSRRDALQIGGLTALGLGLGNFAHLQRLQAREGIHLPAKAKRCILIWLDGGPSHIETFDPKPDTPSEVRGPLESIATSVSGIRLSECLSRTAAHMDKLAIVRSMTSPLGEHNFGTHYLMTGYKPSQVLEYPTIGATLSHVQASQLRKSAILPPHIAVPSFAVGGSKLSGNGFLPSDVSPFSIGSDPSKPDFEVNDLDLYEGINLGRLDRRREFVNALNRFSSKMDASADGRSDAGLEQAYNLITSTQAKQAFRLEDESPATRQKYGPKTIGQSCLLARRLVERGVPFVTVNNRGWDTHEDLNTRLKLGFSGARVGVGLIPSLDLALSALIEDLEDRRLLDETLVIVMGEFGRTPKLNSRGGRDHWPRVFSVALAGGGIQGGQVIGSSDRVGEGPRERPTTPSDLAATIYTLLGIPPELELKTSDGRPVRVCPHGAEPVRELIS